MVVLVVALVVVVGVVKRERLIHHLVVCAPLAFLSGKVPSFSVSVGAAISSALGEAHIDWQLFPSACNLRNEPAKNKAEIKIEQASIYKTACLQQSSQT